MKKRKAPQPVQPGAAEATPPRTEVLYPVSFELDQEQMEKFIELQQRLGVSAEELVRIALENFVAKRRAAAARKKTRARRRK